jgi:circadian clock protein KaiB
MSTKFILELYGDPTSPKFVRAKSNLEAILKFLPAKSYVLKIIDIVQRPEVCEEKRLIWTPTLIKVNPPPQQRFSGTLVDRQYLASVLGVFDKLPPLEEKPLEEGDDVRRLPHHEEPHRAPTVREVIMGARSGSLLLRDVIVERRK